MQKNNQGVNFFPDPGIETSESQLRQDVFLVLQRSNQSQTTRIQIYSAEQLLLGDKDWHDITIVKLSTLAEAKHFKSIFHSAAKRGAVSRSSSLERTASYRHNETFTWLRELLRCYDETIQFVRRPPESQPGYSPGSKKRRSRKSKK